MTTGGGIYCSGSTVLNNCIVWNNTATSGKQMANSGSGSTFNVNYSCYSNSINDISGSLLFSNCITSDPGLVNTAEGDYRIGGTSPCVNAGDNSANTVSSDIRGRQRIQNVTIDMGAYEWTDGVDPDAEILFVNALRSDDNGDGFSWSTAKKTLQAALDISSRDDEIRVAGGTYKPVNEVGGSGDRYAAFQLPVDVALYGGFAGNESALTFDLDDRDFEANETILSGDIGVIGDESDNCYHVFYHPDGSDLTETSVLDGFTISGGNAEGSYGGGMFNELSSPTIRNVEFLQNSAAYSGGGMYNFHSSPVIENVRFISNSSGTDGGGMANLNSSSPSMKNSVFMLNSAGDEGGGIYNWNTSSPMIVNCLFAENTSTRGGAVFSSFSSTPEFRNCTVASNTVTSFCGGILYGEEASSPLLANCILWGNTSAELSSGSYITLINCCYPSNEIDVHPDNLNANYFCISSDPQFIGSAADPEHPFRLAASSPCADAGNSDWCSEDFDIRGSNYLRKLNKTSGDAGTIDMGAYEYQPGGDVPLPIRLAVFSSVYKNGAVLLNWQTASETENLTFRIYRDGEMIAELDGAGTTTEPQNYSYTDQYVIPGRTYTYVLADVDLQGKETKHPGVEVEVKAEGVTPDYNIGSAYPNPFNPQTIVPLNLATDADVRAFLYDLNGRMIRELFNASLQPGSHDLKIDGSDLSTGIYLLQIRMNDAVYVQKIALMK
ncbi:MAG: choice-of-anchor Q domain-containing protein [Candidatus Marinimicrobia bacterium]|nr:choice-of-anchor Q domain-containing protein [Candidatus Neomarinimicrobiota bacterium]